MGTRRATVAPTRSLVRETQAIVGGAVALFLLLALASYSPDLPHYNLGGRLGHAIAAASIGAIGVAAYLFPLYLGLLVVLLVRQRDHDLGMLRLGGALLLVGSIAAAAGVLSGVRGEQSAGGWLGGFVGTALRDLLGVPGALLILSVLVVVSLVISTGISAVDATAGAGRWLGARVAAWRERGWRRTAGRAEVADRRAGSGAARAVRPIPLEDVVEEGERVVIAPPPPPIIREPEPKPVRRREKRSVPDGQEELFRPDTYRLPTLSLLDEPSRDIVPLDEAALHTSARILETKLGDFGVAGKVVAVRPGPVITTFELEPAPGVKVSRIVGLGDDLAMAMRAASVRILAPIPGKPVVGIEVSNPRRQTVYIRELLDDPEFRASASKLTVALGKDTTGNCRAADLSGMPHLLIAGATGTGKSVSMNAMILSILFKASPRDVRMIMIDPKMLELSTYENVPHLLVPVVTDPKRAAAALHNMIREMDERYRLLHAKGVRNIDSYNRRIAEESGEVSAGGEEPSDESASLDETIDDADDYQLGGDGSGELQDRHLPRIVVIIDELADLMMSVGREVEESITRLAQKARAAGIHLILATQRPSVDVITGLIKANFPARISFQVTSRTDSRTILDAIGAERLLGRGDMLFLPPGTARVQRLHGAFVSDEEVHRVVDFVKKQEKPTFEMALLEDEQAGGDEGEFGEDDPADEMYDKAVQLVTEHRQASISWLQRRLRVGYNRAARMIEQMEREGVVSPPLGAKGREVLAQAIDE
jgi:S-DNA-T family DNA segregation ATPase FtsK/SpoIIIE